MNFFFDENFSECVPNGLDIIERSTGKYRVYSTKTEFKPGLKDPILIPKIAKKKGLLVTFDRKALKAHIKLLKRRKVSVIAFSCADKNYEEKLDLVFKNWKKIKEIVEQHEIDGNTPFFLKVSHSGIVEWK